MTRLNKLITHSCLNNIVIGLVLSDRCRIVREDQVIKLKFQGDLSKKSLLLYVYNLIQILEIEFIYDSWQENEGLISFSILEPSLVKFVYHYFYLDERYSTIYTEETLNKFEERKIITSWNTVVYNTLKDEPQYQTVKKYIARRFLRESLILNCSTLAYWFLDGGFYDSRIQKYCLIPANFDGLTLLNVLRFLKKNLNLRFRLDRGKNILILGTSSVYYFESYLKSYLPENYLEDLKNGLDI